MKNFIAELRRRNVLRAALLYAGAVWALAQGIAQLAPSVGAPEWVTRWFLVAAAIGFPFWLAFAWFYEFTPQGLKRERDVEEGASIAPATGRKLNYAIIAVMAVAIVLLLTDRFVARETAPGTPHTSIAVLPLTNSGGDKTQAYFADGISEDLIIALSQLGGLKVIGRSSSFQFRDSQEPSSAIGTKLGVANLLEGSVRRNGDTVRIAAQLVEASTGRTLWSESYDRPFKDLFALQDEIAGAIAIALRLRLTGTAASGGSNLRPPNGNPDAFTTFLRARQQGNTASNEAGFINSINGLDEALRLDPGYAAAQANKSIVWGNIASLRAGEARRQALANAQESLDAALALDPDHSSVLNALGANLAARRDWQGAKSAYARARQSNPNSGAVASNLAMVHTTLGEPETAIALLQFALAQDPLLPAAFTNLATAHLALGQLEAAGKILQRLREVHPTLADEANVRLGYIQLLHGDADAALRIASTLQDPLEQEFLRTWATQMRSDRNAADAALRNLSAKPASTRTTYGYGVNTAVATAYALRNAPDQMFEWLDRAADNDEGIPDELYSNPLLKPWREDPRFAALARRFGLPVPGSAH